MNVMVSMLRGINVSGQKKIAMSDLKALYIELNLKDVSTYIQSGNVVFKTAYTDTLTLTQQIEQKINEKYGFHVPVIIRTIAEMQLILKNNPLLQESAKDTEKLYVTFLDQTPKEELVHKINGVNHEPDTYILSGKEVYLYVPNSYGNTKLNNSFFENKLKVKATTRNWRTVNELYKMMQSIE